MIDLDYFSRMMIIGGKRIDSPNGALFCAHLWLLLFLIIIAYQISQIKEGWSPIHFRDTYLSIIHGRLVNRIFEVSHQPTQNFIDYGGLISPQYSRCQVTLRIEDGGCTTLTIVVILPWFHIAVTSICLDVLAHQINQEYSCLKVFTLYT